VLTERTADRLVFVRHFDPATKKLHYHSHFVLGIDEDLSALRALKDLFASLPSSCDWHFRAFEAAF
jgi:hypothetical protein